MPLIDALPTAPARSQAPALFNTNAEAWVAALATFGTQVNAVADLLMAATTSASTTSLAIGTGSKSFTVETGLGYAVGQTVTAASAANPLNQMTGVVTAYTSGTGALVINVQTIGGSGTYADWVTTLAVPVASVSSDTWTPTVSPQTGAFGGLTYASQTGRKVKFGPFAFVTWDLNFTPDVSTGSPTGNVLLPLPSGYTAVETNPVAGSLRFTPTNFTWPASYTGVNLGLFDANTAQIVFHKTGANSTPLLVSQLTDDGAHTLRGSMLFLAA